MLARVTDAKQEPAWVTKNRVETLSVVEILQVEHRVIDRILAVLVQRLRGGEATPPEDLRTVVEFMRDFSDGCHHCKEEDMFFPALE